MENERYDKFIRGGLHVGFTDDQVDFLEDWILNTKPRPETKPVASPKEERPNQTKCSECQFEDEHSQSCSHYQTDTLEEMRHAWRVFAVVDDHFEDAGVSLNADRIADFWLSKLTSSNSSLIERIKDFVGEDMTYEDENYVHAENVNTYRNGVNDEHRKKHTIR